MSENDRKSQFFLEKRTKIQFFLEKKKQNEASDEIINSFIFAQIQLNFKKFHQIIAIANLKPMIKSIIRHNHKKKSIIRQNCEEKKNNRFRFFCDFFFQNQSDSCLKSDSCFKADSCLKSDSSLNVDSCVKADSSLKANNCGIRRSSASGHRQCGQRY